MTRDEFISWWKDYAGKFPATACWVRELGKSLGPLGKPDGYDEAVPQRLLRSWSEIFDDVPLRDAMAITRAMARGDIEPIGSTHADRERTALTIRRACKAASRAAGLTSRREVERPDIPAGFVFARDAEGKPVTLVELVERCKPLIRAGRSPRQAAEEVNRSLTWTENFDFHRDAYRCTLCQDRGQVLVWHPSSVRIAVESPQRILSDPVTRRTCSVPCLCDLGTRRVWTQAGAPPANWRGYRSKWMLYASTRWCKVDANHPDDDDANQLIEWAACYAERCRAYWSSRGGEAAATNEQQSFPDF